MNGVDNILKAINLLGYEHSGREEIAVRVEDLHTLAHEIKNLREQIEVQAIQVRKYRIEMNHALAKQLEMLECNIPSLDVKA
jgi:2C-methyl-D-erythritol 2,4-cyclodiphosphate synthase